MQPYCLWYGRYMAKKSRTSPPLNTPQGHALRWVDGAVIYQIYPRSFQDSNDDGIGDLPGITKRLEYLKKLGVTGIWISPFYPSPMADFGYDVADYHGVDPMFGTLADFKKMTTKAHKLGIKVIVDIVPSHTSDEHPWFLASKQKNDKYSDWYVWHDPKGFDAKGKPIVPNNWLGMFDAKSAWEWVPERQQFYLHSFHTRQPDLNWRNPEVRAALKDVLRHWMRLGVDGFRVDAVPFMAKDPEFHDNPPNPHYNPKYDSPYNAIEHTNSSYWPQLYEYLGDLSDTLKEKPFIKRQPFMVTEGYVGGEPIDGYLRYYKAMDPAVAAPFNFEGVSRPFGAQNWRSFLHQFHQTLEGFNPLAVSSYAFGNHDQSRLVTRYGELRARAIAVMQLTLPGMIFVYQGEEIGMHDVTIPPAFVQDPGAKAGGGRDPERTPMQWTDKPYAGFSTRMPWLPVARDYKQENVATQSKDSSSFLSLYRRLIRFRNQTRAISRGALIVHGETDPHILAYTRQGKQYSYTTVINFDDNAITYRLPYSAQMVVSSIDVIPQSKARSNTFTLRPHEAIVIKHPV